MVLNFEYMNCFQLMNSMIQMKKDDQKIQEVLLLELLLHFMFQYPVAFAKAQH